MKPRQPKKQYVRFSSMDGSMNYDLLVGAKLGPNEVMDLIAFLSNYGWTYIDVAVHNNSKL